MAWIGKKQLYVIILLILEVITVCALFTKLQTHTSLVDYSYQIDIAHRIYHGEMPYRDFFLVLPPGTYLILAASMLLTGGYVHWAVVVFLYISNAAILFVTFTIVSSVRPGIMLMVSLLALLPITGSALILVPNYYINAVLCILISVLYFQRITNGKNTASFLQYSIFGLLIFLPSLFMQTIGICYALSVLVSIFLTSLKTQRDKFRPLTYIGVGFVVSIVLFCSLLYVNHTFPQYAYQVFIFANQKRNLWSSISVVAHEYKLVLDMIIAHGIEIFYWTICLILGSYIQKKWHTDQNIIRKYFGLLIQIAIFGLTAAYALGWARSVPLYELSRITNLIFWCLTSVLSLGLWMYALLFTKRKQFHTLFILIPACVAAFNSVFLSSYIGWASYSVWPLGILCVAWILHELSLEFPYLLIKPFTILFLCMTVAGQYWNFKYIRFLADYDTSGAPYTSAMARLSGLSAPGIWIPNMEDMFRFVNQHIPLRDRVLFIPGDDPFYAFTDRINPLPYPQMNNNTFPNDVNEFMRLLLSSHVDWIIIKTAYQHPYAYIDLGRYIEQIQKYYTLYTKRNNYLYYHLR